ncbi:MAG: hypothetical protein EOM20_01825 [Spartobacteria bacterium]|nr:hypothetical protein [Spartobacteria bacterium]
MSVGVVLVVLVVFVVFAAFILKDNLDRGAARRHRERSMRYREATKSSSIQFDERRARRRMLWKERILLIMIAMALIGLLVWWLG